MTFIPLILFKEPVQTSNVNHRPYFTQPKIPIGMPHAFKILFQVLGLQTEQIYTSERVRKASHSIEPCKAITSEEI